MVFFTPERTETAEKEFIRFDFWIFLFLCALCVLCGDYSKASIGLRAVHPACRLNQKLLEKLYSMTLAFSNEIHAFC
jgi:hypothetical protein